MLPAEPTKEHNEPRAAHEQREEHKTVLLGLPEPTKRPRKQPEQSAHGTNALPQPVVNGAGDATRDKTLPQPVISGAERGSSRDQWATTS